MGTELLPECGQPDASKHTILITLVAVHFASVPHLSLNGTLLSISAVTEGKE